MPGKPLHWWIREAVVTGDGTWLTHGQTDCIDTYDTYVKLRTWQLYVARAWRWRPMALMAFGYFCNLAAVSLYKRSFPPSSSQGKATMKSTASAVLLLALAGVSLSSAFVPVSNRPGHVTFMATDDAEIDSSTEGAAAEEAAAGEAPPKPAVKCPDCDKCDGSGR